MTRHGMSGEPWYGSWKAMIQRTQGKVAGYEGVSCDPRWEDPRGFASDMAESWFPGAQISRIGDQGDYTPDNCRWLTAEENWRERNERERFRLPDGRFACDVADQSGIPRATYISRVRSGWSLEDACTKPQRTAPTHCKYGHEFTPENTRHYAGSRHCRACARNRERMRRAERRSA